MMANFRVYNSASDIPPPSNGEVLFGMSTTLRNLADGASEPAEGPLLVV